MEINKNVKKYGSTLLSLVALAGITWGVTRIQPLSFEPVKEIVNSNTRIYAGHASNEIVTDMDYDGKYDVLKRGAVGMGEKLFYKKGYGPAQDPGIKYEFVDPEFFEHYDAALFNEMVKEYYRLEVKNE